MKRYLKIFVLIAIFGITTLLNIKNVNALKFEDDKVTTSLGFTMTMEQYQKLAERYSDEIIDITNATRYEKLSNEKYSLIGTDYKFIVTNYLLDNLGNPLFAIDKVVSKEEAINCKTGSQILPMGNSGSNTWQTDSKVVWIDAYNYKNESYIATLDASWYTTPVIKSYDVMAIRWTNSNIGITSANGIQTYWQDEHINYSFNGTNMVNKSNGIGISMNLVDSGETYQLHLEIESSKSGGTYYGTYQHAVRDVTLAQSQSYTFSSSGLGGVLLFNNSTLASYYDDMQGVMIKI